MKRRHLAALAFVLAPLMAACGQGTGGSDGSGGNVEASADEDQTASLAELIRSSATKAAGMSTSRFSMTMEMPGGAGGFSGTGALDSSAGVMTMAIDASGMTGQATPVVPAVLKGDAIYYRFGDVADLGDRPWVKLDVTQLGKLMGIDGEAMMDQFEQSDPKSSLSMMIGVSEDVEELLREDVRGVSTRHFKATIDMNKAIRNAPDGMRGLMEEMARQMAGDSYPAEMWIGDDDLPRRFRSIIDLPEAGGEVVMEMDFFDYGVDVEADVPPADQTMDWYEFMGRTAAG
jgi:hypothetical protein